jgi:hypothetical protein
MPLMKRKSNVSKLDLEGYADPSASSFAFEHTMGTYKRRDDGLSTYRWSTWSLSRLVVVFLCESFQSFREDAFLYIDHGSCGTSVYCGPMCGAGLASHVCCKYNILPIGYLNVGTVYDLTSSSTLTRSRRFVAMNFPSGPLRQLCP